jgi:hypothetical protein
MSECVVRAYRRSAALLSGFDRPGVVWCIVFVENVIVDLSVDVL